MSDFIQPEQAARDIRAKQGIRPDRRGRDNVDAATSARGLINTVTGVVDLYFNRQGALVGAVSVVDVRNYGAVGDGVSDDTAAVQAAIDAAYSETGPAVVSFPAGTFKMNITLPRAIDIIGARAAGRVDAGLEPWDIDGLTVFVPAVEDEPVISIPDLGGIAIRNVRVLGPGAFVEDSVGIKVAAAEDAHAGSGLFLEATQVADFETGVIYHGNRALFQHSSFSGCATCFETLVDDLPCDTLTFLSCWIGGSMESEADVREESGSRTNIGLVLTGTIKGVNLIGCEMGQCGTVLQLGSGQPIVNVIGCNFEANDTGAIIMASGKLTVQSSNSFSGDLPFIDASSSFIAISLLNCNISTEYAAVITMDDSTVIPLCSPPVVVEYTDGYTRQVSSSGDRLKVKRQVADQNITGGVGTVIFDTVHFGDDANYNVSTGEWRCPRAGHYRVSMCIRPNALADSSLWVFAYADTSNGSVVGVGGNLARVGAAAGDLSLITGVTEFVGIPGKFYRLLANGATDLDFNIKAQSDVITGDSESTLFIEEILPAVTL